MRKRGFDSRPVLCVWFFDNSVRSGTHDVAAAYRLARAEVRVQLPLGAFAFACAWRVNEFQRVGKPGKSAGHRREERWSRAHENVGSNPTTLTWLRYCGEAKRSGGSLLRSSLQVRLLPPQLEIV